MLDYIRVNADLDLGLIVFAHGSRIPEANDAVRQAAEATAARCGFSLWEAAFLELAPPNLESAVHSLLQKGVNRIVVAPYFLTMGVHLQQDLPRLLQAISLSRPEVELVCAPPLDGHPGLIDILTDRAQQAIAS